MGRGGSEEAVGGERGRGGERQREEESNERMRKDKRRGKGEEKRGEGRRREEKKTCQNREKSLFTTQLFKQPIKQNISLPTNKGQHCRCQCEPAGQEVIRFCHHHHHT